MRNVLDRLSEYRTELMGISILWIMLFHAGIEAPDNMALRALWYFFISFGGGLGVPIFLILSGMGLMYSELRNSNRGKWHIWANKRFVRIIPAYLIVSFLYYVLKGESAATISYNIAFLNFINDGQRDFWYIAVILLCYCIFPPVVTLCRRYKPLPIVLALSVLCWCVGWILNLEAPHIYTRTEILIQRIPCFLIGMYVGILLYNKARVKYNLMNISFLALGGG